MWFFNDDFIFTRYLIPYNSLSKTVLMIKCSMFLSTQIGILEKHLAKLRYFKPQTLVHCIALHYIALHCIALYCIALYIYIHWSFKPCHCQSHLPLSVTPCHCLSHLATVCHTLPLSVTPFQCLTHLSSVWYTFPLSVTPSHCLSHLSSVWHTFPVSDTPCQIG